MTEMVSKRENNGSKGTKNCRVVMVRTEKWRWRWDRREDAREARVKTNE